MDYGYTFQYIGFQFNFFFSFNLLNCHFKNESVPSNGELRHFIINVTSDFRLQFSHRFVVCRKSGGKWFWISCRIFSQFGYGCVGWNGYNCNSKSDWGTSKSLRDVRNLNGKNVLFFSGIINVRIFRSIVRCRFSFSVFVIFFVFELCALIQFAFFI